MDSSTPGDIVWEIDLRDEAVREYVFLQGAIYRIPNPRKLFSTQGGPFHFVEDSNDVTHQIMAPGHGGCIAVRWKPNEGRGDDGEEPAPMEPDPPQNHVQSPTGPIEKVSQRTRPYPNRIRRFYESTPSLYDAGSAIGYTRRQPPHPSE